MFRNYLVTALNNLLRNRLYAFINLAGLAIGLACTVLIGLFVLDELSYDAHFADAARIYRITRDFPEQDLRLATNAPQVAALLKQDFPEVEAAARMFGGQALLSRDEIAFYEDDVRFADQAFLDIFAFEWLAGDPAQALARPNTVVLTETIAAKYFGDETPLGRSIMLERAIPLEVTGLIRDLPRNTHLELGMLVSMPTVLPLVGEEFFRDWANNTFYTYVKLQPGATLAALEERFVAFMDRHFQENSAAVTGISAMPLRDIHLRSQHQNEMQPPGSIDNVLLFAAIATFILLIACLNFMNLSTARSTRRGKEVGVRKALGASRGQVAGQFIGESLLLTALAGALAVALVELVLPAFNAFLGKELRLDLAGDPRVAALLVALVAAVGTVAGSYPAFFLSAFKPTQVLRSVLARGGSLALRNTLVMLQFAVAIVLVVATAVVVQQLRYAQGFEQGFQRERVVILKGPPTAGLGPAWPSLREELLRHPEILAVTASAQLPLQVNTNSVFMREESAEEGRPMPFMQVDFDFFGTYGIAVLAGRVYSPDFPADRLVEDPAGERTFGHGYVLNRSGAEAMGWTPEEALGKALSVYVNGGPHSGTVIGVVEDSHFESVRSSVKPMVFLLAPYILDNVASMPNASLRLSGRDLAGALAHVDAVWKAFMPGFPMERHFLEEDFNAMYQAEDRQGKLLYVFALLAILIACLGLYGLAAFNAERRTKEIGVRKVMGGSVIGIVWLLTNDFSRLVLLSNLIAWPIAYVAMDRWLQNFAYHISLSPLVFVGSGAIALCIAWVTVGGIAAKAASAKPVLALRYE